MTQRRTDEGPDRNLKDPGGRRTWVRDPAGLTQDLAQDSQYCPGREGLGRDPAQGPGRGTRPDPRGTRPGTDRRTPGTQHAPGATWC